MQIDFGYQIIMGFAIATGVGISLLTQRPLNFTPWQRAGLLFGAFCGAMIGAKLPFVLGDWQGLMSGAVWFQDGKTILCGLAGGYAGVEIAKWCGDIRLRTGDSFVVPVAASVAIGRLGCFHAQCCYGIPTALPWAVVFPHVDAVPRHPTQIYESIFHIAAAVILWSFFRQRIFVGNLMKLYIMAYACYRFATEVIRPEARLGAGLTGYQWASLFLIIVFAALWYRDAQTKVTSPKTIRPFPKRHTEKS